MYKKTINFNNVVFTIQSNTIENLNKQINHINNFYIPYLYEKKNTNKVKISYIEDKNLYLDILKLCKGKEYKVYQSFDNQIHREYEIDNKKYFIIDNNEYICIKYNDENYKIITDGRYKGIRWPFRIVREILVRKNEDNNGLFMHGTGLTINEEGILILGNSRAGKTTLATKLLSTEEEINFLSNDRVFIYHDKESSMEYFPIPIVYAIGTVRNNPKLDNYFRETKILETRMGKNYETALNNDKVDVPLADISKMFDNVENTPTSKLDVIIFSKINKNKNDYIKIRELTDKEKEIKLNQTCFTIFDWDSLRL